MADPKPAPSSAQRSALHAEHLSSGPSPSREGDHHPKEAITRLKNNCTYCPERSKLCWGQRLQEKTEVLSSFGLWKVPGRKAEEVPGTRTDLASLVGSRPASWPQGEVAPAWALGSQVIKLFLCRREDSSLSVCRWAQRRTRSVRAKGRGSVQLPPARTAHQSSAVKAGSLHSPLEQSPLPKAPKGGLRPAA